MKRNLKRVAAFVADGPFTENQLRWWIFNAESNGLGKIGGVVRVGRGVYIDVDAFDRWIEAQNTKEAA